MRWWAVLGFALLLLPGCSDSLPEPPTTRAIVARMDTVGSCPGPRPPPAPGGLPEFAFPCLSGESELTLGTAPGGPTVLNLWAPWCGPCREELPFFERLHTEAGDLVSMVGLVEMDTRDSSLAFASDAGLSFPSALDQTGKLLYDQGLNGLPATFFLRADGSIAHRQIGPIASYDDLRALVSEHLDVAVP